jgi:Protein of unknown function (DUF3352)
MSDHWGAPRQPEPPEQPGQPQQSAPSAPSGQWGQSEILSSQPAQPGPAYAAMGTFLPADVPARSGGKGKWVAAGVAVVAVAGLGVGAAFAAGALRGGGGKQPEAYVPSTSVAFVSFDLDPSLGQKVDALRFLRKFPSVKASLGSTDDLREYIFDQAVKDDPKLSSLSYAKDVKPWIGNRFGVAVLPNATVGGEPNAVVVLQVSDAGKAKAGLRKLMKPGDGTCAVSDGYAVCAETQAILTAAETATKQQSLADSSTFTSDVSAAGSRGIAVGWGDLAKLAKVVPSGDAFGGISGVGALGASQTTGRFVATLRFSGANLELTGRVTGAVPGSTTVAGGTGVDKLPSGTAVAIGGSTSAAALAKSYQRAEDQLKASGGASAVAGLQQNLHALGLKLPQDLSAVLGTKFAIAYGGGGAGLPQIGLRSNSSAAKAGPVLDKVNQALSGAPFALHHVAAGSGYAVALDKSYAEQLAGNGGLGETPAFKSAVPDAAAANLVVFVNFGRLLSAGSPFGAPADANLKALSAAGLTVDQGANGSATFHLNVITH